jgi:hypothetical protein
MSDTLEEKDLGNFNENELKDIMAEIENLEKELNVDGSANSSSAPAEIQTAQETSVEMDDGDNLVDSESSDLEELDELLNEEVDTVQKMKSLQDSVEEDIRNAQLSLQTQTIETPAAKENNLIDFPSSKKHQTSSTDFSPKHFNKNESASNKIHFIVPKEVCAQFPVEISWGNEWSVNIDPGGKIYLLGPGGLNMVLQTAIVNQAQDPNKKAA